jgi:1,4-dihydroxy-2-naphthoyl-CoA synthase
MGSQLPEEAGPRLRLERPSEHVAVVVIDAPASANALNGRFFAELTVALDTIEQDDAIRVWLLTGAPRPDGRPWFSSGVACAPRARLSWRWPATCASRPSPRGCPTGT